jgi:Family of unknown function (DUF6535)
MVKVSRDVKRTRLHAVRRVVASRPEPRDRGKIRSFYYEGVHRFELQAVVKSLPLLLQSAVFLFLAGIVIFVMPMDSTVYKVTLGLTMGVAAGYVIFTCLPVLYHNCPFRTPVSIIPRIVVSRGVRLFICLRCSFWYQLARCWRRLMKYVEVFAQHAAIGDEALSSSNEQNSVSSRILQSINSNSFQIIPTFMQAHFEDSFLTTVE